MNVKDAIVLDIYRKPTSKSSIIPYESAHPIAHRFAAFNFLIRRCLNYPISVESQTKEMSYIYELATKNGFPNKIIHCMTQRLKIENDPLYTKETSTINTYRALPYNQINLKIKKAFTSHNIIPAYKTYNQIKTQLKHRTNSETSIMNESGVYSIKCKNCTAMYVGQTGRCLKDRIKEHKSRESSNIFKHIKATGHEMDFDNAKILHKCSKGRRMDLLEGYEIEKHLKMKNIRLLNDQMSMYPKPLFTYFHG